MIHTQIKNNYGYKFNKIIFNHKCEVSFASALMNFYPHEKDRNTILELINDRLNSFQTLTVFMDHIDYKLTEIVWRCEYIEEINLFCCDVNINKVYETCDELEKFINEVNQEYFHQSQGNVEYHNLLIENLLEMHKEDTNKKDMDISKDNMKLH